MARATRRAHVVDAHELRTVRSRDREVPGSGSHHEAERTHPLRGAIPEGDLDLSMLTDAFDNSAKFSFWNLVPRVRIVEESCFQSFGLLAECIGKRVQKLVARRAGSDAESELISNQRLANKVETGRFIGGESVEVRLESVQQLDAAFGASTRNDRHAGFAQRFDVSQNRAL